MVTRSSALVFLYLLLSGCAGEAPSGELSASAFDSHFSGQQKCAAYLQSLVDPISSELSKKRTVEEMRAWLQSHPDENFSRLVMRMQNITKDEGQINPRVETDQLKITSRLRGEMLFLPGFRQSACGADVHEGVMESFYLAIGGRSAPINEQLINHGEIGNSERQWVLLTALMAGELTPGAL